MFKAQTLILSIFLLLVISCGSNSNLKPTLSKQEALQACYSANCSGASAADMKIKCDLYELTIAATALLDKNQACTNVRISVGLSCLATTCSAGSSEQSNCLNSYNDTIDSACQ
ncbi:MAG: hypothetical protein WCK42_00145 [Myxococcaceae bacterium]